MATKSPEAISLKLLILRFRRALVIALHIIFVVFSNYLAFWLRFDGDIPDYYVESFKVALPWLVAIRIIAFAPFRIYEGLWRYTSVWDLRRILSAVGCSTLLFWLLVGPVTHFAYPRSIHIIDALLLIFIMGGTRLARRVYREFSRPHRGKRVLIYGAGDAGEIIVRDMINSFYEYEPIGFVDDNAKKVGQLIHGVPVLGTREALPSIIDRRKPHEVLVALPTASPAVLRQIVRLLEPFKVPIKTLPNLRDLMDGKVEVSRIRSLVVEDLLPRAPVGLNLEAVRQLIEKKRVLVTGAGGSIGSELCRQIATFRPESLILFERYENSLYAVSNDLSDRDPSCVFHAVIGDITDARRLESTFKQFKPEIVFHAAAHKHVPMMQINPCEAIKNNVVGTRLVAEIAQRNNVDRLILISTDKAVHPTSVMGATKRIAELMFQAMTASGTTRMVTVRFGNVLDSNGSVVPRFVKQIRTGGPVTVTHPDVCRYFMLIPEAVQLVLQAATLAEPGALYVLEMGEPIRVVEMARNLIRLSGFVPDEEIPITFIGLRPGEKLREELFEADERPAASGIENVVRVTASNVIDKKVFWEQIRDLERHALLGNSQSVLQQLQLMIPNYGIEQPLAKLVASGCT
jgi:FlaA1/EpsC-like NDP-sugar epimerase